MNLGFWVHVEDFFLPVETQGWWAYHQFLHRQGLTHQHLLEGLASTHIVGIEVHPGLQELLGVFWLELVWLELDRELLDIDQLVFYRPASYQLCPLV